MATVGNAAQLVAWICLVAGLVVLGVGAFIGVRTTVTVASEDAKKKLDAATKKTDDAEQQLHVVKNKIGEARALSPDTRAVKDASGAAEDAADKAAASIAEAKSALEQIGSIIGSLPENLRFAGMLVLVGTILISVATIQFGGTSLF